MQSHLPKFVQINWCGEGVPENKKGLFHTHSSAVARFLRGTHVAINARNEVKSSSKSRKCEVLILLQGDVAPAIIMSKVKAASGVNYTAQKEAPRKFEPIAPVGTNYTPVGKIDINELRKAQSPSTPKPPPPPSSTRPAFSASNKPTTSAASLYGRPAPPKSTSTGPAPTGAWPEEEKPAAAVPPPPPASSRPPTLPTTSRPAFSAMVGPLVALIELHLTLFVTAFTGRCCRHNCLQCSQTSGFVKCSYEAC